MFLVMFQVWQGMPGINPQVFLAGPGNEATFSCFPFFQTLNDKISKNIISNPCGFICDSNKEPLNKCAKFR